MAALLFGVPEGAAIFEGADMIAPALLPFEIADACIKKRRRHPDHRNALIIAFDVLDRIEVGIVAIDHQAVIGLAERPGVTACDASYLWLAQRTTSELIMLDRQLAAAEATDPPAWRAGRAG